VLSWNPLVWILDIYRWVFLGDAAGMQITDVLTAVLMTAILLIIGLKFFALAEHRYGRP